MSEDKAAAVAPTGSAVGIDLSTRMIDAARGRASGLKAMKVGYLAAIARWRRVGAEGFDLPGELVIAAAEKDGAAC